MALSRTMVVSLALHGVGIGLAVGALGGLPGPRPRVETTGFFLEQQAVVPMTAPSTPMAPVASETVEESPLPDVEVVPVFEAAEAESVLREFDDAAAERMRPEASLAAWRLAAPAAVVPVSESVVAAAAPVAVVEPAARVLSVRAGTNRAPEYPLAARRRGCTGTVLLVVEVAADGAVVAVAVQRSCGHRVLDDAAVTAVRGWAFDGGPGRIEVPIEFVLRG